MIAPWAALPDAWLADAELSLSLDGRRAGLSVFFVDDARYRELCELVDLPDAVRVEDTAVRARLPVVPRRWLKHRFEDGEDTGWSQYFAIDPSFTYPIASLRWVFRRFGADASKLEPILEPALARGDALFIVSVRHGGVGGRSARGAPIKSPSQRDVPRVSCRAPRALLSELLARAAAAGALSAEDERVYREWNARADAGPFAHLTLGPDGVLGVDLEDVGPGSLPQGWERLGLASPRYVKCRARGGAEPDWVLYGPAVVGA